MTKFPLTTIYSSVYARLFLPPPHHTAVLIAEWITAKEEKEEKRTASSFVRYQTATTNLLNDDEARDVMKALLYARRAILGD